MSDSGVRAVPATVDHGVILVLLTRLAALLAAPITLWLIATTRPLAEQGPYFVFWNTQALTQLMELSIGGLIVQFASHESTLLAWGARGELVGDAAARLRMYAVIRAGRRWYRLVALIVLVLGGAGGSYLFQTHSAGIHPSPLLPWFVTLALTAAYLPVVPLLCAIEGCGGLLRVQRMRLAQIVLATAVVWMVLVTFGALWAVAAFAAVWFAVPWCWLRTAHRGLITEVDAERPKPGDPHGERAALTAVQWRTGATWIASWIAPQAITPIVLATHGPAAAGQVGMSVAIAMAPATLASAWLQGRYPQYGAFVARGDAAKLGSFARRATGQAMIVCALGTAAAALFLVWLEQSAPGLAARALPAVAIAVLGVANLAWLAVQSLSSYLRAWREEPLTEATVAGAALIVAGTAVASSVASTQHAISAYALLVLFGMLPLTLWGFRRHHRA